MAALLASPPRRIILPDFDREGLCARFYGTFGLRALVITEPVRPEALPGAWAGAFPDPEEARGAFEAWASALEDVAAAPPELDCREFPCLLVVPVAVAELERGLDPRERIDAVLAETGHEMARTGPAHADAIAPWMSVERTSDEVALAFVLPVRAGAGREASFPAPLDGRLMLRVLARSTIESAAGDPTLDDRCARFARLLAEELDWEEP